MINIIGCLIWSHFNTPFTTDYLVKIIGYCYHSVYVINLLDVSTVEFGYNDHDYNEYTVIMNKKVGRLSLAYFMWIISC